MSVIPAQAGIQEFLAVTKPLDTRFRGYDDFLRKIFLIYLRLAHHFNVLMYSMIAVTSSSESCPLKAGITGWKPLMTLTLGTRI